MLQRGSSTSDRTSPTASTTPAAEIPAATTRPPSLVRQRLKGKAAQPRPAAENNGGGAASSVLSGRLSWRESLQHWLTGPEGVSLAVSAVVHTILFLCIALGLYLLGYRLQERPGQSGPIEAIFTEQPQDNAVVLESIADVEFELPDEAAPTLAASEATSLVDNPRVLPDELIDDLITDAALLPALPESSLDLTSRFSGADGEGWQKGGFAMPLDKNKVVTRGSFSVWTVPEDPQPFKSYRIVIQLNRRVPIRDLRSDVTGTVQGTDGYRATIGYVEKGLHYPRQLAIPKARQIVIEVPPAKFELVRDVIEVHSKALEESQKLEIVF